MDDPANFRKGIVAQSRVDLRRDIGCEIPHRPAREQSAQIDRQQNFNGLAPHAARNLLRLQVADGLHHNGSDKLRYADAKFLCFFLHSGHRQHERGKVQEAVRLRCSAQMIGRLLGAAGRDIARVAQEAVLQFLRVRVLQTAQNAVSSGDIDFIFLAQIFCNQRLEEDQTARAVRDCMEKLHSNASAVNQHTESAFAYIIKRDMDKRITFILFDGRGFRDLLEIVPEHTSAQPDSDGRKTPHCHIQCRAQHAQIDVFRQRGRQAEIIRPVPALCRRVYFRGVVQPHPAQLANRREHARHKPPDCIKIGHVFIQIIQHIRMPALRRNDDLALAAGIEQLFMEHARIIEHDLVPADEQKRRRQACQIAEQR